MQKIWKTMLNATNPKTFTVHLFFIFLLLYKHWQCFYTLYAFIHTFYLYVYYLGFEPMNTMLYQCFYMDIYAFIFFAIIKIFRKLISYWCYKGREISLYNLGNLYGIKGCTSNTNMAINTISRSVFALCIMPVNQMINKCNNECFKLQKNIFSNRQNDLFFFYAKPH